MAFRYPLTCSNFYLLCFLRMDPGSVGISTEIPIRYTHCFLPSFLPSLLSFSFSAFFLPAFLPSSLPPSNIMFPVYYAPGTGDPSLRSISATKESLVQGLSLQTESQMGHQFQPAMFQTGCIRHCLPGLQNLTCTALCPFPCVFPHMECCLFFSLPTKASLSGLS